MRIAPEKSTFVSDASGRSDLSPTGHAVLSAKRRCSKFPERAIPPSTPSKVTPFISTSAYGERMIDPLAPPSEIVAPSKVVFCCQNSMEAFA